MSLLLSQMKTTSDLAKETGLSVRQVQREAKTDPGLRQAMCPGKVDRGPGNGLQFKDGPALRRWVERRTVCRTFVDCGPGRKGRSAFVDTVSATEADAKKLRYTRRWDDLTTAANRFAKQLPKSVNKIIGLKGVTRQEDILAMMQAIEPIVALHSELTMRWQYAHAIKRR
jgi:hypothetical protein